MRSAWILGCVFALPSAAQLCRPQDFQGVYGFQLSGRTTISGDSKPVASMGRLEFDGQGSVSGTASVNFAGYFLGNPVNGTYEVRGDCSVNWSLQDDSGAWQRFTGKVTPDLQRGTFRQSDPGGAQRGILAKVAPYCSGSSIQGAYDFAMTGSFIPMNPGDTAGQVSLEGVPVADAAGNLTRVERGAATNVGTIAVDSDCIVNIVLTPLTGPEMKLRGILVSGGREILAIETDPGAAVNASLRAR